MQGKKKFTCLQLTFCLVLLAQFQWSFVEGQRILRKCRTYIRTRSTAQNQFEETKTTEIRPRCSLNEIIWYTPKYNHIVSFQDSSRKPFSICLSRTVQGTNIYQLIGTSRRLLIGANNTGELGCFESQCNHLTLYFEIVSKLPPKITYRYHSAVINKCPKCTEVCQRYCICSAQYVFIGLLQKSKVANGLYTHYFKVSEFIRHNGIYNEYNRQVRITQQLRNTPQCVGDNTSVIRTYDPTVSEQMSNTLSSNSSTIQTNALTVPQYGLIKVYGKCPLTTKTTHLISASFSSVVLSGKSRDKLVMCCGEEDYAHASYQLREMLLRHQCCSSA